MKKILVINGPCLGFLGIREPEIYGTESYPALVRRIRRYANDKNLSVRFVQSDCEGKLVRAILKAYHRFDGIVLNPAAYTHTSIALADAVKTVGIPTVEVHISDPDTREDFRHVSYIRSVCVATVKGQGTDGYLRALDILSEETPV